MAKATVAELATKVDTLADQFSQLMGVMTAQQSAPAHAPSEQSVVTPQSRGLHPWHVASLPTKSHGADGTIVDQPPEVKAAQAEARNRVTMAQMSDGKLRVEFHPGTPCYRSGSMKSSGVVATNSGDWIIDGHKVTVQVTAYYKDEVLASQIKTAGQPK